MNSATTIRSLISELGLTDGVITLQDVLAKFDVKESLPWMFEDGIPTEGCRSADQWIVFCARRYGWPPSVTRAQRMRDLHLLLSAEEAANG